MNGCGWKVWQEKTWPFQWIGQCGDGLTCRGGIRCNSKADAVKHWNDGHKSCPLARGAVTP